MRLKIRRWVVVDSINLRQIQLNEKETKRVFQKLLTADLAASRAFFGVPRPFVVTEKSSTKFEHNLQS